MRTLRSLLLALLVCLAVAPPAATQPSAPPPATLTLAQAVEQALARNRDLVVSRKEMSGYFYRHADPAISPTGSPTP
ncbi:MAG TPA: hypothetical protein VMS64_25255 [Candidatus Methylomirabilis sp.]|nr:hypothetical protein [Candidatus Methylomirabilis sp.]